MSHKCRDLIVWQKAKTLSVDLYRATERFPKVEIYGLTSQLQRAGVSVVSNVAEGQGRLTRGEFAHFLGQARGSLLELETQLEIALELGFLEQSEFNQLSHRVEEVNKLLNGLISSLRVNKR